MNTFVILSALLAVSAAQYYPYDTPEVAQARAAHFAALAQAQAQSFGAPVFPGPGVAFDDGQYRHDPSGDYHHVAVVPAPAPGLRVAAPVAPLPYQYAQAPLVPATRLYDDGQYHQDINGHYIHRLVPAPQN